LACWIIRDSWISFKWIISCSKLLTKNTSLRAYCGRDGGTPATVIDNGSKIVVLIRWTRDFSPEWNPQKRCEQVSRKIQQNLESGALVEIVPARANGYPVVCAAPNTVDSVDYTCPDAQILITLRPEDNANSFIDQIFLSNVDVPVDENGFGKKDGRDFVCLSRGASGSCSGLLIMANEL
jgi:hypothetical protein